MSFSRYFTVIGLWSSDMCSVFQSQHDSQALLNDRSVLYFNLQVINKWFYFQVSKNDVGQMKV